MNIDNSQLKINTIMKTFFLTVFVWGALGCQNFQDKILRSQNEFELLKKLKVNSGYLKEKISPPSAVMTLIHVRQQHDSEILTNRILAELKHETVRETQGVIRKFYETQLKINKVQKDIYDFVLTASTTKSRIYTEGVVYPRPYRNLFAKTYRQRRLAAIDEVLQQSEKKLTLPKPPYYLGASFALHDSRQRSVIGVEHGGLLNFTTDTYINPNLSKQMKIDLLNVCHSKREQEVIKNIVKPDREANYIEPSVKFLIFGSSHDFTDDVSEWNKNNPQKQIRLVTFTPESL